MIVINIKELFVELNAGRRLIHRSDITHSEL